jgi:hypothetical protein
MGEAYGRHRCSSNMELNCCHIDFFSPASPDVQGSAWRLEGVKC